jgi:hypothetical protein
MRRVVNPNIVSVNNFVHSVRRDHQGEFFFFFFFSLWLCWRLFHQQAARDVVRESLSLA